VTTEAPRAEPSAPAKTSTRRRRSGSTSSGARPRPRSTGGHASRSEWPRPSTAWCWITRPIHSLLQKNVLNRQRWQTREQLRLAIVVWIEKTYHRRRRQDASDA
jgi:hypothetical protein